MCWSSSNGMSKRKGTDTLPKWARLLRFHSDSFGSLESQPMNEDCRTVKRRCVKNDSKKVTNKNPISASETQYSSRSVEFNHLEDYLFYEQEDSYLRLEAYRVAAAIIERHLIQSIEHELTRDISDANNHNHPSPLQSWINFVQKFETKTSLGYYHSYHPTLLPVTVFHSFSSSLDRCYITEILSKLFVEKMTTAEHISGCARRPAVCILHCGSVSSCHSSSYINPLSRDSTLKTFYKEILKQCIEQEDPHLQGSFHYLLHESVTSLSKQQKIQYDDIETLSFLQRLVLWAQRTDSFHSIAVIVEDPESIPLEVLDALIRSMSRLRSNDFVPIHLALCSISFDPSRWRQLEAFNCNVVVHDAIIPSTSCIFHQLFSRLYPLPKENNDHTFPIIPSKEILNIFRVQFHDFHGSVITFVHEMKLALAHHFARKGSFLAMTDVAYFTDIHQNRLAWFCLDHKARSYLLSSTNSPSEDVPPTIPSSTTILSYMETAISDRNFLFLVIQLVHYSHNLLVHKKYEAPHDTSDPFTSFLFSENSGTCLLDDYNEKIPTILNHLSQLPIPCFILFMVQCARFIQSHLLREASSRFTKSVEELINCKRVATAYIDRIKPTLHWINECIVLLHALVGGDPHKTGVETTYESRRKGAWSSDQMQSFEQALRKSISTKFENLFHRISNDWCVSSPLSMVFSLADERSNALIPGCSFKYSILTQPRRQVSKAIGEMISEWDQLEIGNDVRLVFSLCNARVIDASTWFTQYANELISVDREKSIQKRDQRAKLLKRFAFAVYQLIHMGIVSKSRRNDDVYEKNAMVWIS